MLPDYIQQRNKRLAQRDKAIRKQQSAARKQQNAARRIAEREAKKQQRFMAQKVKRLLKSVRSPSKNLPRLNIKRFR